MPAHSDPHPPFLPQLVAMRKDRWALTFLLSGLKRDSALGPAHRETLGGLIPFLTNLVTKDWWPTTARGLPLIHTSGPVTAKSRGTWTHFLYQTHTLSTRTSVLFTVILWVFFYGFNFIIYTFLEGGSHALTASVFHGAGNKVRSQYVLMGLLGGEFSLV